MYTYNTHNIHTLHVVYAMIYIKPQEIHHSANKAESEKNRKTREKERNRKNNMLKSKVKMNIGCLLLIGWQFGSMKLVSTCN